MLDSLECILDERLDKSNMQKMHTANSDKPVEFYNIGMIKSKRGVALQSIVLFVYI